MHARQRVSLLLACALFAVTAPTAHAQSRGKRQSKPGEPKVRYANGDTEAQRRRREEARLRRECQGRPNAGACLGYAR